MVRIPEPNGQPSGRPDSEDAAIRAQVARELTHIGVNPQEPSDTQAARSKARGDYYADCAFNSVVQAQGEADALRASNLLRAGQVFATLAHRDAVQESTATLKQALERTIEANAETVAELRRVA